MGITVALSDDTYGSGVHKGSSQIALSQKDAYAHALSHGFALIDTPICTKKLSDGLIDERCGAKVVFEGLVRNHNNQQIVTRLNYYGYEALALNEGARLAKIAQQKFDVLNIIAMHRIGALAIGDMAVWVGAVAAHRQAAFLACQWYLDAIKESIPVWKQEFYGDGEKSLWLSNNG